MILLLHAILFCIPFVRASLPGLNNTFILAPDASNSPPNNDIRTLWDIIWSCGITLFACAWTAMHPNIPGMNEKKLAIFFRRILIMFTMLIAPELILTWASLQLYSALAAKKQFNGALGARPAKAHDKNSDLELPLRGRFLESSGSSNAYRPAEFEEWTVTHGFFAWMGGFMLYVDREPRATLTPDELLHFIREGSVDMPDIQKEDIEDRSKGDVLSKGVAILQLVWFILQLIARGVQNLPMTLLEIDTLAIAILAFSAYILWWTKPKDVARPYIVHWKSAALPPTLTYDEVDPRFSRVGCSRYLFRLIYPCLSAMGMGAIVSRHAAQARRVPSLGGYGGNSNTTMASHCTERDDMTDQVPVDQNTSFIKSLRRIIVPLFGARMSETVPVLIGSYSGVLLGGVHCLGWNFSFRRPAELILWRVASIIMACAPMQIITLVAGSRGHQRRNPRNPILAMLYVRLKYLIPILGTVSYLFARITIFVLMILSFQSLPPGVYDTVDWTAFFPHW